MKIRHRLLIMLICFGIMTYHLIVNWEILGHPYMVGMFIFLGLVNLYQAIMIPLTILDRKKLAQL